MGVSGAGLKHLQFDHIEIINIIYFRMIRDLVWLLAEFPFVSNTQTGC